MAHLSCPVRGHVRSLKEMMWMIDTGSINSCNFKHERKNYEYAISVESICSQTTLLQNGGVR